MGKRKGKGKGNSKTRFAWKGKQLSAPDIRKMSHEEFREFMNSRAAKFDDFGPSGYSNPAAHLRALPGTRATSATSSAMESNRRKH
jgi:hypothetical protein